MIAVVKTGGKQYKVSEGNTIKVEKLAGEKDAAVHFDEVLMVGEPDGSVCTLGTPIVSGAKVTATIVRQGRAPKIDVIKYKPKVRYRKKTGHRQAFTEVKIEKITA